MKKIGIASDHVGVDLKNSIKAYVEDLGLEIVDFGPLSKDRTDYPKYGKAVADAIVNKKVDGGILICGTGVGISISANKVKGIRAVVCSEPYSAKLSREHNNTNIVAFGARVVGEDLAKMIVKEWLNAEYEGGRHGKRLEMIEDIESGKANADPDGNFVC
ncbi:ribose 5-phosphate isomerase B [Aerococcus sp. HMSC10H05]|uniref:ribose 5-phosphate isomerase B n=1 Tax=Aerococcus sp. HMSC10H05 TaxID=1581084 RepID=UPI0008A4AF9E|nr:ribose 5-phosphate isomerase B [Aerococcus sp. HMSC10H05]OFU52795.1 ribose-5-phosphate isomerase [Aerococcus sp. HMSC10H05]